MIIKRILSAVVFGVMMVTMTACTSATPTTSHTPLVLARRINTGVANGSPVLGDVPGDYDGDGYVDDDGTGNGGYNDYYDYGDGGVEDYPYQEETPDEPAYQDKNGYYYDDEDDAFAGEAGLTLMPVAMYETPDYYGQEENYWVEDDWTLYYDGQVEFIRRYYLTGQTKVIKWRMNYSEVQTLYKLLEGSFMECEGSGATEGMTWDVNYYDRDGQLIHEFYGGVSESWVIDEIMSQIRKNEPKDRFDWI